MTIGCAATEETNLRTRAILDF